MEKSLTLTTVLMERHEDSKAKLLREQIPESMEGISEEKQEGYKRMDRGRLICEIRADQMRHLQMILMNEPTAKHLGHVREEIVKFRSDIDYCGNKAWLLKEHDEKNSNK